MTKTQRTAIIGRIDAETQFDVSTIRFHRDGSISGIKDADKARNAAETMRLLVGHVSDLAA